MIDFWSFLKKAFAALFKWLILGVVVGALIGLIMSGFGKLVDMATAFRHDHLPIIFGLPLAGLLIVYSYRRLDQEKSSTSSVMSALRHNDRIVSFRLAPLILISTVLTHLFGGSTGREGAALQFGGSVGSYAARHLKMSESNGHILMMAAMSAAFSALFGTPLAAAIFPMEFISVGVMYYAALVPCILSSFVANSVAIYLGVRKISIPYEVTEIPVIYSRQLPKAIIFGILCALLGMAFCMLLHYGGVAGRKYFKNPYIRVVVGGLAVIALALMLRTTDYLGLGETLIHQSFSGSARPEAFLLKMVFTALTLCMGYKGGEIVPSFVVGATFGCLLSGIFHLPVGLMAACGMCGVFCAVTNSPITSLLIAFELFGFDGMGYFAIVIAISYMLSGNYSIWGSQKIIYSKFETRYINKVANDYYADVQALHRQEDALYRAAMAEADETSSAVRNATAEKTDVAGKTDTTETERK